VETTAAGPTSAKTANVVSIHKPDPAVGAVTIAVTVLAAAINAASSAWADK
jgi:hypothetical protein